MKAKEIKKGDVFGRLTALGIREVQNGKTKEKCVCSCGNVVFVLGYSLVGGKTKSCGCLQKEKAAHTAISMAKHNLRYSRIYRIYYGAYDRCNNINSADFSRYGGRGIKMRRKGFEEFYNDMNKSYMEHVRVFGEKDTTIDRINPNGDYCKENCRRATRKEQSRNKTNIGLDYKGTHFGSIMALCEYLGKEDKYSTIRQRLRKGRSIEDAVTKEFKS